MTQRGGPFDAGPNACPFVALELDRDRRSERPDYRHRCYAEQVPAPRTIAHQERYCLSPNFAGCPIFQDWAVRAAARPVPLPPGYEGRRAAPDPRQGHEAAAAAAGAMAGEAAQEWPDSMDAAAPPPPVDEPASTQQLSAFDAPPPPPPSPVDDEPLAADAAPIAAAAAAAASSSADTLTHDEVDAAFEADDGDQLPPLAAADVLPPLPAAQVGIPIEPEPSDAIQPMPEAAPREPGAEEAAAPAFLAGRSSRPPRPPDTSTPVPRDDVVPSWELTDRYGAQGGGESGGDGVFGRLFTIIAVVLILALGVAAVILIPGLLGGSQQSTPRPSLIAGASRSPLTTLANGSLVTPTTDATTPPSVEPTADVTPAPTPRLYRIKPGDTLAKIGRRFRIEVADILAANPQIPDANHIEVGQFIIIPVGAPPQ